MNLFGRVRENRSKAKRSAATSAPWKIKKIELDRRREMIISIEMDVGAEYTTRLTANTHTRIFPTKSYSFLR